MVTIPEDIPLPRVCPDCAHQWTSQGMRADGFTVILGCTEGNEFHFFDYPVTEVQALEFQLANDAESLLSRSIWLEGTDSPIPNVPPIPVAFANVGEEFGMNGGRFRVTAVETDRVWVRLTV